MDSETFIQNYLSDELEHHGVKGMRWGHRKKNLTASKNPKRFSGTVTKKNTTTGKQSHKKHIKSLSDSDIQSRIKRLENEKKLSKLEAEDLHPGRVFIKGALKDSGKQVLTTVGKNAMIGGLRYATDKSFTGKDFTKSLFSTGGSSKKKEKS